MTLEFNCPKCGALIAFDSKYAGKRAKCLTCGQKFLIPAENFRKPERIEPEPETKEPVPGFYHAVFVDGWKVFVNPANVTTLVFVVAVVCFKFFLAGAYCCVNHITSVIIWGWLFGFYLNVISRTAIDDDLLPEIDLGTSITFLWYVIEPFLTFLYTLFLVELPFFITLSLVQDRGVTVRNFWSASDAVHVLLQVLFVGGLFLFPVAILTTAVGRDFTLLRPDYLLAAIFRAFIPYLTAGVLLTATCITAMHTTQYTGATPIVTAAHLALNLTVQVLAIITMRSIGLLYRHYGCYFKW